MLDMGKTSMMGHLFYISTQPVSSIILIMLVIVDMRTKLKLVLQAGTMFDLFNFPNLRQVVFR